MHIPPEYRPDPIPSTPGYIHYLHQAFVSWLDRMVPPPEIAMGAMKRPWHDTQRRLKCVFDTVALNCDRDSGSQPLLAFAYAREAALRLEGLSDYYYEKKRSDVRAAAERWASPDASRLPDYVAQSLIANVNDSGVYIDICTGRLDDGVVADVASRFLDKRYQRWVYFLDNASAEFVLGALPIAILQATTGAHVSLVVNSGASLNDLTVADAGTAIELVAERDDRVGRLMRDGQISLVESGMAIPLLDLRWLTYASRAACQRADAIVWYGMGRALQTNYQTNVGKTSIVLAIWKDPWLCSHWSKALGDVQCSVSDRGPGVV